jgi:hypothetical protein
VERTARELDLSAVIESVQVGSEDEAARMRFLGSPTIQIDGVDIEASRRTDMATFACRVYQTANGLTGVPPRELLLAAISEAKRKS